jgi:hypothetical protein
MTSTYENYVFTKQTALDIGQLHTSCYAMYEFIKSNLTNGHEFDAQTQLMSHLYAQYNLLMYPYPGFYELYEEIKTMFREHCQDDSKYYIQSWLNFYRKDQYIDWHSHYKPEKQTWHGFICVDCEPSCTTYRIPGVEQPVDVPSKNGQIVLSASGGDQHRTWPWPYEDRPRITIAFDILPRENLNKIALNRLVPL